MKQNISRKTWRILSIMISALMIVGIITPFPAYTAYALDIPQPIHPENYSTTTKDTDWPLGIPYFSWTVVTGATKYRLQVDNVIDFSSPNLNITTSNTSFTPASTSHLFTDGTWFWRVRVESPSPVGEWSDTMEFTKLWSTEDNNPLLLSPDEGDTLAFFNYPDFSWTRVMGAAKYRFQIALSQDGFSDPEYTKDTLQTSHQPNVRLVNGTYYWRVVPMDAVDHLGTPSETRSFNLAYGTGGMVPSLIEPSDGSHPVFTPTFRWTAVEGAELYTLEYASNVPCVPSSGTRITTRQTTYTPTDTFLNDKDYCWHVRVEAGPAEGDWSPTWTFQKRWYLLPQLLTPKNLYQNGLYPLYSWTPVPGAAQYKIEIAKNSSFNPVFETATTANTIYTPRSKYDGTAYYYWRVTPTDGGGSVGKVSETWEYQSLYYSTAPIQIYPLYYYPPNSYYGEFTMNPYEDRTVAYPIFIWHRVMVPTPVGGVYASAYRIQVDTDEYFEPGHVLWEYDTENTSASPTNSDDFNPIDETQDYYWRVCVLDHIGGDCVDPVSGWSQIWRARFDDRPERGLILPPTTGDSPELLRPAHGQESVEATPLLEWWPFEGATQYEIEISRDPDFVTTEISETVNIPAYSPVTSLAQRRLNRTDYGTFYWRVRGYVDNTWSDWSNSCVGCAPWRFQIASQSEWQYYRELGNPANRVLIGNDDVGDQDAAYDLSTLNATQCYECSIFNHAFWFFGFNANFLTSDSTYVLYLDLDHVDGSGAPIPPATRFYSVTTVPAHQPEFAIYVDKLGGVINAQNTWVYRWDKSTGDWDPTAQRLDAIGGYVYALDGYVELQIPNAAIGMDQSTSSASVILFSVDRASGSVVDSVPSDPQAPGSGSLSRFSAVSDHMNLISPPNTASGDPSGTPSILPFYWDWPTGSDPSTPYAGIKLEVHLDPGYTNSVADVSITSTDPYFSENHTTLPDDINGNNTYYWRIQPRYMLPGHPATFGAWTSGWSFSRDGFKATNLQVSVTSATPTFSWDMVEGASTYQLHYTTDPNFGTFTSVTTPLTTFTPSNTLTPNKTYYWRVRVNRNGISEYTLSQVEQFDLVYSSPIGLIPNGDAVQYAPTFCWDWLPNAYLYRLQVSLDPAFGTIFDTIDTPNHCWTPTKGYPDADYYWHVAMIDGNNRLGNYSETATFTKQYPVTTLVSPIGGAVPETPTFYWTPVDGAATYLFQVAKSSSFSQIYDTVETINTQFTPTKIYDMYQNYYWRVAIVDLNSRQGPFSDTGYFYLGAGGGGGIFTYLPLITR